MIKTVAIEQTCLGTMALLWKDRQSGEGMEAARRARTKGRL